MGVLRSNVLRGLATVAMLAIVTIATLSAPGCGAQSSVEPGRYYLKYHVIVNVDEPRLYMEGDVRIDVVVKELGIAYLVNAGYNNVKVHKAAEEISESKAGALLITIITDFIDIWLSSEEIPQDGVVTTTSGAFKIKATYDKPTGFLTHAEYSMKPGSREVIVNLVGTNVPGLTAHTGGGGGFGLLPLLIGIGIAITAVAVVVVIVRNKMRKRTRYTYSPLPPPPPPPS